MTYEQWAARHPRAARELIDVLNPAHHGGEGSEAKAQQAVRFAVAQAGGMAWRNNVGATPSKCEDCGAPQRVIRYGLANDSTRLNKQIKSSDLILAIPRVITADLVGSTIAQFGSVEVKKPGWRYTGAGRERGQATWLALIKRLGGLAQFSTGEIHL